MNLLLAIDININPDIGTFGPLTLSWHGLFTAVGIAASVWLIAVLAHQDGMSKDTVYNMALIAIPGGIVGARLLYVIEHIDFFADHPANIFAITEGGISVMGAIIGGALATWIAMLVTRTGGKALLADACGPGVMLGQAIGRIGDLINGEHHAITTDLPWAVRYIHPNTLGEFGLSVHPVAGGYELVGGMLIVGLLLLLRRRVHVRAGYIFWSYAIVYSIMRFSFSPLRTNEADFAGTALTVPQFLSLVVIAVSVAAIAYTALRQRGEPSAPAAGSGPAPGSRRLKRPAE